MQNLYCHRVGGLNKMLHIRNSNEIIFRAYLRYIRYYYNAYYDDRKSCQVERGKRKVCSKNTGLATHFLCSYEKTTCLIFLCFNFLTSEWEIL